MRVHEASRAPSCSGSCSRFPRAVTNSRSVNSASPVDPVVNLSIMEEHHLQLDHQYCRTFQTIT